jgi:thiamine-phosphate pyrophosphorylase
VINDHFELARELEADFCHLGQEDFFGKGLGDTKQLRTDGVGPRIGLSTHRIEEAQRALRANADYIAIGPVYATATKPGAAPVTLDYVRWAAANVAIPWFAIGGITLANLGEVIAAGARRICVVSDILNAPDITARCREFKQRIARA